MLRNFWSRTDLWFVLSASLSLRTVWISVPDSRYDIGKMHCPIAGTKFFYISHLITLALPVCAEISGFLNVVLVSVLGMRNLSVVVTSTYSFSQKC